MWLLIRVHKACLIVYGVHVDCAVLDILDVVHGCSKEAQKCCCGAANCRGYIGGEKTKTLRSLETGRSKPSSSTPKVKKEKRMKEFDDLDVRNHDFFNNKIDQY